MLWSWADLLALRAISWLRSVKPQLAIARTTMREVRSLLKAIEETWKGRLGDYLASKSIVLRVDAAGRPFINVEERLFRPLPSGAIQTASSEVLVDLLAQYEAGEGLRGPHLLIPRPRLRIIPGKLGGEPHVEGTRIETRTIKALIGRGYALEEIVSLYPFLDRDSIEQSIDLEVQLDKNLGKAAA